MNRSESAFANEELLHPMHFSFNYEKKKHKKMSKNSHKKMPFNTGMICYG